MRKVAKALNLIALFGLAYWVLLGSLEIGWLRGALRDNSMLARLEAELNRGECVEVDEMIAAMIRLDWVFYKIDPRLAHVPLGLDSSTSEVYQVSMFEGGTRPVSEIIFYFDNQGCRGIRVQE